MCDLSPETINWGFLTNGKQLKGQKNGSGRAILAWPARIFCKTGDEEQAA